MARHYESSNAVCPFYRMEDPKAVYCEGINPGWTIRLSKDGKSGSAKGFKRKLCYNLWEQCPIAQMLQRIYK